MQWNHFNSGKICQITYAKIQGKFKLSKHFKTSSIMHQKDEKLKPIIVTLKLYINLVQNDELLEHISEVSFRNPTTLLMANYDILDQWNNLANDIFRDKIHILNNDYDINKIRRFFSQFGIIWECYEYIDRSEEDKRFQSKITIRYYCIHEKKRAELEWDNLPQIKQDEFKISHDLKINNDANEEGKMEETKEQNMNLNNKENKTSLKMPTNIKLNDMVKMFKPRFNTKMARQNINKLRSGVLSEVTNFHIQKEVSKEELFNSTSLSKDKTFEYEEKNEQEVSDFMNQASLDSNDSYFEESKDLTSSTSSISQKSVMNPEIELSTEYTKEISKSNLIYEY